MDKIFKGYIPQQKLPNAKLLRTSHIIFDTSALFNLYRYKKETANAFLESLEVIQDNLKLPYTVALEYHTQRATVLNNESKVFSTLKRHVSQFKNKALDEIQEDRHYTISKDRVKDIIDKFELEFSAYINDAQESHPNYLIKDPIRDKLFTLFEGKTEQVIPKETLESLYLKANTRFDNKIPPGFMDFKNKQGQYKLYGTTKIKSEFADFIIWTEIISIAKNTKKNIILVTDEKKEDWCWKENGMILGPRPELVTEIQQEAGVDFYLISSLAFLESISKLKDVNVSSHAINNVKEISTPTWKEIVTQAFAALGGSANLNELYSWIEGNKPRELTKNWHATARKTVYYYCSDRDLFYGKEDIFEALDDSTYRLRQHNL